jgi:hypothetical protein
VDGGFRREAGTYREAEEEQDRRKVELSAISSQLFFSSMLTARFR